MSTDDIKAIETRYAGCHFRSRLEARWAVFFDHCEIEWEYEPEGFVGCSGTPYLPDFYLPSVPPHNWERLAPGGVFVEVKGTDEALKADSDKVGECIDYGSTKLAHGLLILGPIPHVPERFGSFVSHQEVHHRKGVESGKFVFAHGTTLGTRQKVVADYDPRYLPNWDWNGNTTEALPEDVTVKATVWNITANWGDGPHAHSMSETVWDAYRSARSARFEHGQSGAT